MQARFDIRTGRLVRIHVASRKGVRAVRADDGDLGIDSDDFDYVFNGLVYSCLGSPGFVVTEGNVERSRAARQWFTCSHCSHMFLQCGGPYSMTSVSSVFKGISYHKFSLRNTIIYNYFKKYNYFIYDSNQIIKIHISQ